MSYLLLCWAVAADDLGQHSTRAWVSGAIPIQGDKTFWRRWGLGQSGREAPKNATGALDSV